MKKLLVPGFRRVKCKNESCGITWLSAMTYSDPNDCVCSITCKSIVERQVHETLWRFN